MDTNGHELMAEQRTMPAGSIRRLLLCTAIIALAVRVVYAWWVSAALGIIQESDAYYINEIAKSLAVGRGFVVNGMRVYNQSPGYPYFLSVFYRTFGDGDILLVALNIGLATLAAVLTAALGMTVIQSDTLPAKLGPYRLVLVCTIAALAVFAPVNLLYIPMAAGENLLVPLLALFLLVVLRASSKGRAASQSVDEEAGIKNGHNPGSKNGPQGRGRSRSGVYLSPWLPGILSGVIMGACLSVKAYVIFIAPLPLLLWLTRGRRFYRRAIPLYVVAMVVVLAPWSLKNYRDSGGEFVPFAAVSGEVFLDSNNPQADGRPSNVITLPEIEARGLDPIARDKAKFQAGLEFIRNDPAWAARLQLRKLMYSFSPVRDFMFEHRQQYRLFTPAVSRYVPTLFNMFVLLGFIMFLVIYNKRNVVWLTGLACFGVPLILQQIFAAYTRYRYPFLYAGLVFAVLGWGMVFGARRGGGETED